MNINYEAEARRKQEEQAQMAYQRQRDPFKYGQDVARRRYSEIMSGLQERQQQSSKAYSDLYQQARETAVAQRAAGSPSLSGGMQAQYSDLISSREMRELGGIGASREQAAREIDLQRQSAFANAELEGMQATQLQLQNQQSQLGIIQQRNQVLSDNKLTNEQKAEQLKVLGYGEEANRLLETPDSEGPSVWSGIGALAAGTITGGKLIAGKSALAAGLAKFFGGSAIAVGGSAVLIGAAALLAALYGVERIAEASGVRGGQGLVDWAALGMK